MTDQQDKPVHPGAYCAPSGATGNFATGRGAICSPKKPGDRARWRASEPAPAKKKRDRRTPLGVIVPDQQVLQLPTEPPAAVAHHTQIAAVPGFMATSIACTCGQSRTFAYARPTGEPVARRLAALHGARHEEDPAGHPLRSVVDVEAAEALETPPSEHIDSVKDLMAKIQREGRYDGLRTVEDDISQMMAGRSKPTYGNKCRTCGHTTDNIGSFHCPNCNDWIPTNYQGSRCTKCGKMTPGDHLTYCPFCNASDDFIIPANVDPAESELHPGSMSPEQLAAVRTSPAERVLYDPVHASRDDIIAAAADPTLNDADRRQVKVTSLNRGMGPAGTDVAPTADEQRKLARQKQIKELADDELARRLAHASNSLDREEYSAEADRRRADYRARAAANAEPSKAAPARSTADEIRDAYARLGREDDRVGLAQLRAALPAHLTRAEVDRALTDLASDENVSIGPEENQKTLGVADRDAEIILGGQRQHIISMRRPYDQDAADRARTNPATASTSDLVMAQRMPGIRSREYDAIRSEMKGRARAAVPGIVENLNVQARAGGSDAVRDAYLRLSDDERNAVVQHLGVSGDARERIGRVAAKVAGSAAAAATPTAVDAVRADYSAWRATPEGGKQRWMPLDQLRAANHTRHHDRAAVDAALLELAGDEGVTIDPEMNRHRITDTVRDASIRFGGEDRHQIAIDTPEPEPQTMTGPASDAPSGWSNAARRRAARRYGRGGQSNPLGERTGSGPGYTEYEDTEFGDGGRAQIWDKS